MIEEFVMIVDVKLLSHGYGLVDFDKKIKNDYIHLF